MNNNRKRTALCLLGATLCVFMAFGAALYFGRYPITLQALLAEDAMAVRTFTVLRLPRAVMALAGGFGLGVAGFVYQTVFRNPLASRGPALARHLPSCLSLRARWAPRYAPLREGWQRCFSRLAWRPPRRGAAR